MNKVAAKFKWIESQLEQAMRHMEIARDLAQSEDEHTTQELPSVVDARERDAPVVRRAASDRTQLAPSPPGFIDEESQTRPVVASGPAPQGWYWVGQLELASNAARVRLGPDDIFHVIGPEVPMSVIRALVDRKREIMEAPRG